MKTKLIFTLSVALASLNPLMSQDGAKLFKQNCGVCHTVGKGKLVGPDLKGTHTKYEEDWLIKWIKSSQSLVKKNDPIAVKIFEENNKVVMPDQTIPESDIKSIIAFVKEESEKPAEVATTAPVVSQAEAMQGAEAQAYKSKPSSPVSWQAAVFILSGLCILLVIVIIAMGNVISGMAKAISEKEESLKKEVLPSN